LPAALILAGLLALCGCALDSAGRAADAEEDTAAGPTIYGKVHQSVDHVSAR
jgi:hypothetical protein